MGMLVLSDLDVKLFYRLIEFVCKLEDGGLTHECYKQIALNAYTPKSKEEQVVKRFSDAYLYMLNQTFSTLTSEQVSKCYFLLTSSVLQEELGQKLLEEYYLNYDLPTHHLVTIIHLWILKNIKEEKIKFAFIFSNYILIRRQRNPIIPYEYFKENYQEILGKQELEKGLLLIKGMEVRSTMSRIDAQEKTEITILKVIESIKKFKEIFITKYKVQRLYLYGSVVKQKTTKFSDVDLLIKYQNNTIAHESEQANYAIRLLLKEDLKVDVDLLDFTYAVQNLDMCEMENIITLI